MSLETEMVLSKLREHAPELMQAGIKHLRLFGSVARGDAKPGSDVDLLADFDTSRKLTLLTMSRLESRLAELLGHTVDLSSAHWLREPVKKQAMREAILAF